LVAAERGGAISESSMAARAAVDYLDEGSCADERLVTDPFVAGQIPARLPTQLVIGGAPQWRRRLTLTVTSVTWDDCELAFMEKLPSDVGSLGAMMKSKGKTQQRHSRPSTLR
jgi:hypothetical protein